MLVFHSSVKEEGQEREEKKREKTVTGRTLKTADSSVKTGSKIKPERRKMTFLSVMHQIVYGGIKQRQ